MVADKFITLHTTVRWDKDQRVLGPTAFNVAHIVMFTPTDDGRTYISTHSGGYIVQESYQEVCDKIHG